MQLLSKFKSIFKQPEKPKSTEEQIEELVNKLILKLKADGKSIALPEIDKGCGSFSVFVNDLGTEKAEILIMKFGNCEDDWEVRVKPIFNKF